MQQFQKPQGSVMHPKEVDKLLGLLRNALINLGPGIELDIPGAKTTSAVLCPTSLLLRLLLLSL